MAVLGDGPPVIAKVWSAQLVSEADAHLFAVENDSEDDWTVTIYGRGRKIRGLRHELERKWQGPKVGRPFVGEVVGKTA